MAAYRLRELPTRPLVILTGLILVAAGYWGAVASTIKIAGGNGTWSDWFLPVAGLYVPIWYWLLLPRSIKRRYERHKALQEPAELLVTPDGLSMTSIYANALMPWKHIYRWQESKHVFLIYSAEYLFHVIPKRCLDATEVATLQKALRDNVGPANNSSKPTPLRGAA